MAVVSVFAKKNTLYVVLDVDEGAWKVISKNGRDASVGSYERKREATREAREWLKARGGGELIIESPTGRVVERNTIGRSR